MSYLTSKTAIQNKFTTPNEDEINLQKSKEESQLQMNQDSTLIDTRPLAIRLAGIYSNSLE